MPAANHQLPTIFDRRRVRMHRDRASGRIGASDFLLKEMGARIAERLGDMRRPFPLALDLGAHHGLLADHIMATGHIKTLVQADMSMGMVAQSGTLKLVADEEFLPFAEASFDLVISAGSLHWVNDLPGSLIQINRILKPDGLFVAVLPGGETLKELRQSFEQAELSASGGISPRISPFVDIRDAGRLLQRAGFAEPVIDSEMLAVSYEHPLKLLHDLRNMGEANALLQSQKGFLPCSTLMLMADYYLQHFSDEHGRIPATFELVTMTGWKSKRA
jgi:SAM-dependent methyltransferase